MTVAVVVFGPPLPGRDLLEQALARGLPATAEVIVEDLRTAQDRVARARALAAAGRRTVFVAREPAEDEAWREVFHHYAGIPPHLAELRWRAFLDDRASRDPSGGEVWPVITLHGREPIADVVRAIAARVGDGEPPTRLACRVLVVDDDPRQVELLGDALTALGCDVTTAASAEEAIGLARAWPFDLVVSDERMPGLAGTELAAALSTVQPGLRVAIVTGFADLAASALPRGPNVDVVLAKPVGLVDLIRVVDEMSRHP
jgi:CheY-like chemotaxis protein